MSSRSSRSVETSQPPFARPFARHPRRRRGLAGRAWGLVAGSLIAVVSLSAALVATGLLNPTAARAQSTVLGTPILFVHGFDGNAAASFNTCPGYEIGGYTTFGSIVQYFKTQPTNTDGGWTGTMDELLYYAKDTANDNLSDGHVSHDIDHHSRPGATGTEYYGSSGHTTCNGTSGPDLNEDADIRHIAYHLAWYIHDQYGSAPVYIIAHSMGGLIVRWMLYAEENPVSVGLKVFPGRQTKTTAINVAGVMAISTPNNGTSLGCAALWLVEGQEMCGGSSFLNTLNGSASGLDPTGATNTAWTTMGSNGGDTVVSYTSATYMSQPVHKVVYESPTTYAHGGYLTDQATTLDATLSTCGSTCPQGASDTSYSYVDKIGYHSIREMSRALLGDLATLPY